MVPSAAALLIALVALMPPDTGDGKAAKARLDVLDGARCLSRDDIIRRVGARAPRVRFADDAPLLAAVALTSQRAGAVTVTLTLGTVEVAGAPRRVTARSCAEAADAVALILAVTLDPTSPATPPAVEAEPPRAGTEGAGASGAAPATSELRAAPVGPSATNGAVPRAPAPATARAPRRPAAEPSRELAPPSPPAVDGAPVPEVLPAIVAAPLPAAEKTTEAAPTRWQLGGSVAGQVIFGAAPAALPGIALSLMIAADRDQAWAPALIVGWTHVWRSGLDQTGGTASFTLDAGTADACPLRWRWSRLTVRPCASLLVGRIAARGTNTEQPGTAARPFSTAGLTINAVLGRTLELSARLGLGLTLIRDSYAFGDDVFYRASLITTSASLGVGALWP